MTSSHYWRCSNTLYIYKEYLLWVWTGWGVSIISTNRGSKCESMHNITLLGPWEHISGWSYTLMTRCHCWRYSNTLYIYKEDLLWVWTGWGVSIISTNRGSKCESMHNITLLGPWEHISGWSYTLMTRCHCWRCSNTLYIYKEDLLWVLTGWGVSIPSTNRGSKCESMHNITLSS
jgi:hypothetical protein